LDLRRLGELGADATEHRHRLIQAITKVEPRGDDPDLVDALRNALKPKRSLRRSLHRSAQRLRLSVYQRLRMIRRTFRSLLRRA
jgi:hypothetical protein